MLGEGEFATMTFSMQDRSTWLNETAEEFMHRIMLMRQYTAEAFPIPEVVTLIKASEPLGEDDLMTPSVDNGWREHIPNIKIQLIPGNHQSIIREPHVRQLASIINDEVSHMYESM
jgi:thioesterase domain-containing protein